MDSLIHDLFSRCLLDEIPPRRANFAYGEFVKKTIAAL